jgi:hypothetical protein
MDGSPPASNTFAISLINGEYLTPQETMLELNSRLPSRAEAERLRDLYFTYGCWQCVPSFLSPSPLPPHVVPPASHQPISRAQFDAEFLGVFYSPSGRLPGDDDASVHRLAALLLVFAIGYLMDPRLPPFSAEAERFHTLGRAALLRSRPLERPTLMAVQAMVSPGRSLCVAIGCGG